MSPWGWKQNALIEVNPADRTYRYTPEYYAVKHFSHFIAPGSRMAAYAPRSAGDNMLAVAYVTPDGSYVVVAGNFNDEARKFTAKAGRSYIDVELPAHSFNTFVVK